MPSKSKQTLNEDGTVTLWTAAQWRFFGIREFRCPLNAKGEPDLSNMYNHFIYPHTRTYKTYDAARKYVQREIDKALAKLEREKEALAREEEHLRNFDLTPNKR